jgi:Terminase large subunit, T4likevirus-type, N-terminal
MTTPSTSDIVYERPWMYPLQLAAIFDCKDVNGDQARYAMVEASTKAGKTVACLAWLFEQAIICGAPGRNYWWVAPVYPQAKIAFRRLKRGLPRHLFTANEGELTLTLPNGAVIWFKSGEKPDNLYGEDVFAVVIDEASRVREDSWHAVRSVITKTRGSARIIGNVKGRKNWFFKMSRRAEAGAKGMSFSRLTAHDAVRGGVLDAAEIEDARDQLPENVFRELYLAEASDDSGNPFGHSHIAGCTVGGYTTGAPVAFGIDLAKSVDWSVVTGLDKDGGVCGMERWQSPWDATEDRILSLVGKVPSLVDCTGVGDPIVERLQKRRRNVFEGFHFSSSSKQKLMEGLVVAMQNRTVRYPDGPIVSELENFEYVYTRTGVRYSAPEGFHDDCVMSLALAVEKYRHIAQHGRSITPSGPTRAYSPWLGAADEQEVAHG